MMGHEIPSLTDTYLSHLQVTLSQSTNEPFAMIASTGGYGQFG